MQKKRLEFIRHYWYKKRKKDMKIKLLERRLRKVINTKMYTKHINPIIGLDRL
jgi:hypothetical protein